MGVGAGETAIGRVIRSPLSTACPRAKEAFLSAPSPPAPLLFLRVKPFPFQAFLLPSTFRVGSCIRATPHFPACLPRLPSRRRSDQPCPSSTFSPRPSMLGLGTRDDWFTLKGWEVPAHQSSFSPTGDNRWSNKVSLRFERRERVLRLPTSGSSGPDADRRSTALLPRAQDMDPVPVEEQVWTTWAFVTYWLCDSFGVGELSSSVFDLDSCGKRGRARGWVARLAG